MNNPQALARLLFNPTAYGPTSGFAHAPSVGPGPGSFAPQVPMPQERPWVIGGSLLNSTSQPNGSIPLPRPNPLAAAAAVPGAPLSLAPPPQQPLSQFNGPSGPQWSDQQWQNFWDRSTPTF